MKINFNTLAVQNSDAAIEAAIKSVSKRVDGVQMDIHRVLVAIAARWENSGDIRPVVKHMNMLLTDLPKGIRLNAIRAWIETHIGLIYAEEGENKGKMVAGKRKASDLNMPALTNERWFEFKAEPEYKPMNFDALWQMLVKKAQKADSTKGDVVDKGLLDAMQKARADYMLTKNAAPQAPA